MNTAGRTWYRKPWFLILFFAVCFFTGPLGTLVALVYTWILSSWFWTVRLLATVAIALLSWPVLIYLICLVNCSGFYSRAR